MMRAGDVVIIAIIISSGQGTVAEIVKAQPYARVLESLPPAVMLVAHAVGQADFQTVRKLTKQTYWLSLWTHAMVALFIFFIWQLLTHLCTKDSVRRCNSQLVGHSFHFWVCL